MAFAIFKGETSLKDLVSRLFSTAKTSSQPADATTTAAVEVELLQANPQLSDLNNVSVGTVLTIPAGAPPLNPSEQVTAQITRRAAAVAQAVQSVTALNQQLTQADARAVDAANTLLGAAQSADTQQMLSQLPNLKQQLPSLVTSLQTTVKEIPTLQTARSQNITALISRLQSFGVK